MAEAGLGVFLFVERKSIHVKKNFDIKISFLEGTRGQFLFLFSLPRPILLVYSGSLRAIIALDACLEEEEEKMTLTAKEERPIWS